MASCHDMKKGKIHVCREWGLELLVVNEFRDSGKAADSCGCRHDNETCSIFCCGKEPVGK